jgi:hypothetical protein
MAVVMCWLSDFQRMDVAPYCSGLNGDDIHLVQNDIACESMEAIVRASRLGVVLTANFSQTYARTTLYTRFGPR